MGGGGGYCSLQTLAGICLTFYYVKALGQRRRLRMSKMSRVQVSITTQDNGFHWIKARKILAGKSVLVVLHSSHGLDSAIDLVSNNITVSASILYSVK